MMKTMRNLIYVGLILTSFVSTLWAQNPLETAVRDKIQSFFEKRFAISSQNLRINFLRLPDLSKIKPGQYSIECKSQTSIKRLGHQTIWLCLMKNQKLVLKTPVTVEVAIKKQVFLTNGSIGFRQRIGMEQIEQQELWLTDTEVYARAIQNAAEIIGKESTHFIPSGKIILKTDVQQPSVVKPGDEVEILVRAGELVLKTKGIARSAGSIGDVVSVKNLMTGKQLKGKVTSPGVVFINQSRAL